MTAALPQGWQLGSALPPEYLAALKQQLSDPSFLYANGGDDPMRFWEQRGNQVELGDPNLPYTIRAQYGGNPMSGGQLTGYELYDNTGISGGGQALNGRPDYFYDASGNLKNTGTISGRDDRIHLADALPAAAVAFGGPLLGMGLNTLGLGGSGLGALETVSEGFGPAFEASVANGAAGSSMLPGLETVSEGFGPGFEQSVANGTWQMPGYPADYGSLPLDGVPPPANPYATPNGAPPGAPGSTPGTTPGAPGTPGANVPDWLKPYVKYLGPAATIAGGLLGSHGTEANQTQSYKLPDYLTGPVTNDLIPRTMGLLNTSLPTAQTASNGLLNAGTGLLSQPVAPNGYGRIQMNQPDLAADPFLTGAAEDIQRRARELLDTNNLAIQGRYAGMAGTGNTRQGVAQGTAAAKAADYMTGQLSNLYSNAWNQQANRNLSQYLGDQSFYSTQRNADQSGVGVGAGLTTAGLESAWQPLKSATDIYGQFKGYGTTTNTANVGGGAGGTIGGLIGGAGFANKMGWWA